MGRAFAKITFTPAVKAAQDAYGTRASYRALEQGEIPESGIGLKEQAFIAAADSFYMASVTETGWPYLQHRGGPAGFLKVITAQTLAFADFRGNGQYLSVGNLSVNDRVCLFLMDYPNRRRLKIWGRAKIVHEHEDPQLIAQLVDSAYRAQLERAFVFQVEALDWNCPQHITPRFTESSVLLATERLREENRKLKELLRQALNPGDNR